MSQTYTTTCDRCGKQVESASLLADKQGWIGVFVESPGARPQDLDFCSASCLTAFAVKLPRPGET